MCKDKKVLGSSQHGFMKEKLCLTEGFYKEMTSSVDERRAVNIVIYNLARLLTLFATTSLFLN